MSALMLIPALANIGMGIYSASKANRIDPALQEAYDLLREQAREGLPGGVESMMLNQGASRIAGQANAMQSRGAMSLASRGMGNSSIADAMIGSVNKTQAEAFGALQESVMKLDTQMKSQALGQLPGVAGAISQQKQAQETAAWSQIASGVGDTINVLSNPQDMWDLKDVFGTPSTPRPLTQGEQMLETINKGIGAERLWREQHADDIPNALRSIYAPTPPTLRGSRHDDIDWESLLGLTRGKKGYGQTSTVEDEQLLQILRQFGGY